MVHEFVERILDETPLTRRLTDALLAMKSERQNACRHTTPKQQGADERELDVAQFGMLARHIRNGCWKQTRDRIHHQQTGKQNRCPNRAFRQKRCRNI
jgi:hypothetical protein